MQHLSGRPTLKENKLYPLQQLLFRSYSAVLHVAHPLCILHYVLHKPVEEAKLQNHVNLLQKEKKNKVNFNVRIR